MKGQRSVLKTAYRQALRLTTHCFCCLYIYITCSIIIYICMVCVMCICICIYEKSRCFKNVHLLYIVKQELYKVFSLSFGP